MSKKLDTDRAYSLQTPEASRQLYAEWADTYDSGFAQANHYILPEQVARHFALMGGFGPVLDVGAGTGLCGQALRARGIEPVDGTDISPEMLAVAEEKGTYRTVFVGDILTGLDGTKDRYQGAVSAGTFTTGHVGPEGLDAMLNAVRRDGWVVVSVNTKHYETAGFAAKIAALAPQIHTVSETEVAIYGPGATRETANDTALLLAFRKR